MPRLQEEDCWSVYVELGNPHPVVCAFDESGRHVDHSTLEGLGGAPAVTYVHVPEGNHVSGEALYGFDPDCDLNAISRHILARGSGVTRLPGHEALLSFIHPAGAVGHHAADSEISWVRSDNAAFAAKLADFYGCPVLDADDDIDDTHWTVHGAPGVVPGAVIDMQANITQNGRDMWARALGGGQVGATGQATGSSATTLTNSGASWTVNQWAGCTVYASVSATAMVFGIVVSNTSTALTVDQWYTVATPGGGAGSTPSSTATYVIIQGNSPAWFMGLSTSTTALGTPSTNTSLPSEYATSAGGLYRKICPYAHTTSANTYTLTPVYTVNGSDSGLPYTVGSIGVFDSAVVADTTSTMLFNTLLATTATVSTTGDQLTITETVTGT